MGLAKEELLEVYQAPIFVSQRANSYKLLSIAVDLQHEQAESMHQRQK